MRLACPHCGERSVDEFVYQGDASIVRPSPDAPHRLDAFVSYAYERTNSYGLHRELWFHAMGCHAVLVVTRNVATHAIIEVASVSDAVQRRLEDEARS